MSAATSPGVPSSRRWADAVADRLDVLRDFDPGYNQLLVALGVMAGVSTTLGVIYLFVQLTHAMWISAPAGAHLSGAQAAALATQHHAEQLIAMLVGGIVGMLSTFAVADTERRPLTLSMALMPIPMLGAMAVAVQFVHHRALGILAMAVVMGLGTYMVKFTPRIGQRAFLFGQMMFVGYIVGFLSRGAITSSDLGWIAAILWVAAAVNWVLKLAIFLPLRHGALMRTTRACGARARAALAAAGELWAAPGERERSRARRRLARRLNRLNEAALIADALLAAPEWSTEEAHARMFDVELDVQNIGRLVDALVAAELPGEVRAAVADCLARVGARHVQDAGPGLEVMRAFGGDAARIASRPLEAGRVLRLCAALEDWTRTRGVLRARVAAADPRSPVAYATPVTLFLGNLPGASLVSQEAAAPPGSLQERFGLDLPAQSAIRLTIAVVAAAALGSLLSTERFYWAVLAVFISFVGTSTSGEQVYKAGNRVAGTVIGILIGSLLAHAVGASTWSVLVIVLALGIGIYFIRASYALMVIGITITVSQLYVQLGEYSNGLLVLRLEETAIGAAIAALAAVVVLPLRTSVATRVAVRAYYDALDALLARVLGRLDGAQPDPVGLSTLSRGVDAAAHELRSAALPLTRSPFRRDTVQANLLLFGQASHHARNLAAQLQRGVALDERTRHEGVRTLRAERRLLGMLRGRVDSRIAPRPFSELTGDDAGGALTRELRVRGDVLGLSLREGNPDERQFALHLARLDETLAELGDNLSRRTLADYDAPPPVRWAARVTAPR